MSNTIYWDPSPDANPASYELESAPAATGPWSAVATVVHNTAGANYNAGPPPQFFYLHAAGSLATWYRIRAIDGSAQASAWSYPFQVGVASSALPTSALDIVQMALANIGETTTVASLTTPTTKGEQLGVLFYERVRDWALRKVAPKWAIRRAELVQLTDHERDGWGYVYMLPPDALRVIDIDYGFRGRAGVSIGGQKSPRWTIEADNLGVSRVLCTDEPPGISVVYVAQLTNPTAWDPSFIEAVTWLLSAKLCMPMVVKPDAAAAAAAQAKQALLDALADDASEQRLDAPPESEFITGRSW